MKYQFGDLACLIYADFWFSNYLGFDSITHFISYNWKECLIGLDVQWFVKIKVISRTTKSEGSVYLACCPHNTALSSVLGQAVQLNFIHIQFSKELRGETHLWRKLSLWIKYSVKKRQFSNFLSYTEWQNYSVCLKVLFTRYMTDYK